MKNFINKIEDYLQNVSLEEISDRRFVAILDIYKHIQKQEDEEVGEVRDDELLSFLDSLEDLHIE